MNAFYCRTVTERNGAFLKQSLIDHDSFFLFFLTTLAFLKLSI